MQVGVEGDAVARARERLDGAGDGVAAEEQVVAAAELGRADDPAVAWTIVDRLWRLCDRAIAFTSLSGWAVEQPSDELHLDPAETLARCRSLTPLVTIRHDYLPHDFAVYLYREGSPR